MTLLADQQIVTNISRTYHVHVPDSPPAEAVPAIIVFHGGGQDVATIARHWGIDPPNPVPAALADYLLVFPEADSGLGDEWAHFTSGMGKVPTHDLDFVEALLAELITRSYGTGSVTVPNVSADPEHVYVAGFSNGGGMVWQLMNSDLVDQFRGFATVGKALDPEKAAAFRSQLAAAGGQPSAVPAMYVHGTADTSFRPPFTLAETPLDTTLPAFTVQEMADRNGFALNVPATTQLVGGSTNLTEVVLQLFLGTEAFAMATVIHGGHNWPTPTTRGNPPVATHFDATEAIVDFWHNHAALP